MDKRFIFRYRLLMIKSWQVTLDGRPGAALELSASKRADPSGSRRGAAAANSQSDPVDPLGQEKPCQGGSRRPYRRPTQVGGGKYPKVDGRPLVKELGKLVP